MMHKIEQRCKERTWNVYHTPVTLLTIRRVEEWKLKVFGKVSLLSLWFVALESPNFSTPSATPTIVNMASQVEAMHDVSRVHACSLSANKIS